jgi:hypothetical protein
MKKQMINETVIHKTIIETPNKVLRGLKVLASEVPLYPAYNMITREVLESGSYGKHIGRIDLILKYRSKMYVTEIKYCTPNHRSGEFWDSMKVLGYEKYYRWQNNVKEKTRPAVIVPKHSIKLEQQFIASSLGIQIFAVVLQGDSFVLQPLNDKPIWFQ